MNYISWFLKIPYNAHICWVFLQCSLHDKDYFTLSVSILSSKANAVWPEQIFYLWTTYDQYSQLWHKMSSNCISFFSIFTINVKTCQIHLAHMDHIRKRCWNIIISEYLHRYVISMKSCVNGNNMFKHHLLKKQ